MREKVKNLKGSGMRARRGRSKAVEIWGWATAHRCVGKFSLMHPRDALRSLLRDLRTPS